MTANFWDGNRCKASVIYSTRHKSQIGNGKRECAGEYFYGVLRSRPFGNVSYQPEPSVHLVR